MRKIRKPKADIYTLADGPYGGNRIRLTGTNPSTLCFRVGRQCGHYARTEGQYGNLLKWQRFVPHLVAIATPPPARPSPHARALAVALAGLTVARASAHAAC